MRHVAEVGLTGVVHERGERILDVTAALLDYVRHDHTMLGNRIEDAAVAAEPALVRQRTRDIASVELLGVRVEWIHPASRDGLQIRTRGGWCVVG